MGRHRAAGHRQREQVAQEELAAQVLAVVLGAAQHAALPRLGALGRAACRHAVAGVGARALASAGAHRSKPNT